MAPSLRQRENPPVGEAPDPLGLRHGPWHYHRPQGGGHQGAEGASRQVEIRMGQCHQGGDVKGRMGAGQETVQ